MRVLMSPDREEREMTAAKRGDLVVIQKHNRDYVIGQETREYDTFTVGIVTSVTRDGMVKMFKEAGHVDHVDYTGKPDRGQAVSTVGHVRTMIVPAADVDVAGALATAACHVWVTDAAHETHVKAYESVDELRAALLPHRTGATFAGELHEAAVRLGTARREAWESYERDTRRPGQGFDSARYHAYEADVAAANEAYRAEYSAATELALVAA
jgi:hypothetical protein